MITPDPTEPPADVTVRLTDRECAIQAPATVAAGQLRVDVENASSYGADVNIIRGIPESEGGLPFDEQVKTAKKVVAEANEAIQAGREPTWDHGETFDAIAQDVVLSPKETGRITATMEAGTGFFLCFLGYSDSERLPVFLSPPFVVE